MWKFITKIRAFLFGILLGQAIMLPALLKYKNYPKIEALPVPTAIFDKNFKTRTFVMHNVPWERSVLLAEDEKFKQEVRREEADLLITICTEDDVQKKFFELYKQHNDAVLGFYDRSTHHIYCMDSVDVLIHEMRHVFEGAFHRS